MKGHLKVSKAEKANIIAAQVAYQKGDYLTIEEYEVNAVKSWQTKKIGEVCTLKSGTTVNQNLEEASGEIPYLKVADTPFPVKE